MKKLIGKIPNTVMYVICLSIICVIVFFILTILINIESMARVFGEKLGSDVGKLAGSFEAFTDYGKAYEEGKREGLSAEDTTIEKIVKIKEMKNLEVLIASVKLNDVHSVGDEYKALYLMKCEAIFTVDLEKAIFDQRDDGLHIMIPNPEMEIIANQKNINKIAEYQKSFFAGSAKDGFDAYLNSMVKILENSKTRMANYDSLMESAKESAKRQVIQLANSVSASGQEIYVEFLTEQN